MATRAPTPGDDRGTGVLAKPERVKFDGRHFGGVHTDPADRVDDFHCGPTLYDHGASHQPEGRREKRHQQQERRGRRIGDAQGEPEKCQEEDGPENHLQIVQRDAKRLSVGHPHDHASGPHATDYAPA